MSDPTPDQQSGSEVDAAARLARRLDLKRLLLRTMIVSLTVCALVAVGALLLGRFNETTARILWMLGALAFHSGFAMVCALSLERRRWPQLSTAGLVLFSLNFAVLITCIWWSRINDVTMARALGTTACLVVFYGLAIPWANSLERRQYTGLCTTTLVLLGLDFVLLVGCIWWPDVSEETVFRAIFSSAWALLFPVLAIFCAVLRARHLRPRLAAPGLAACAAAFVMVMVCTWAERSESPVFAKATAIVVFVAFSFTHTALLLIIWGEGRAHWLLGAVTACIWALAAMASGTVIWEVKNEFWWRLLGAMGVLDASGTLALAIMVKLRQIGKIQKLQSAAARVELRCPRCATMQTVDAGASQCGACGLKFRIEIEEPRCATCDYLLWQLPERRCPECGTPF